MLRGEITPCGFPGVLGGARVAEKKARGLRIGETENVGAVLMEQENSPRAPVSLPGGSVAPSSSFPFNSVKHSLFGLRLGNEILIAPLRTRISCCALPQPADSFFGFFFKKTKPFKKRLWCLAAPRRCLAWQPSRGRFRGLMESRCRRSIDADGLIWASFLHPSSGDNNAALSQRGVWGIG